MYMLQVYLLVAVPIFVLAGLLTLALFVWSTMKDYARARRELRRIVLVNSGRPLALPVVDPIHHSRTLEARTLEAA
jgi:hypothetical protein